MNASFPPNVETITNTVTIGDDGRHGPDKIPSNNASTDVNFIVNEPTDVCGGTTSSITINSDTRWTPFNSPFIVNCDIIVASGATLTLEQGTIVKFANNKGMEVAGTLIVNGRDFTNVLFTANSGTPTPGFWDGIDILAGGQATIQHAHVSYGGSTTGSLDAAIYAAEGATLTLTDSTLTHNGSDPLAIDYDNGTTTQISNLTANNNLNDIIRVSGSMSASATWDADGVAFVTSGLTIGSTGSLTIAAGTTLKFDNGNASLVVSGHLTATGTVATPVAFTSIHDDTFVGDTNGSTTPPNHGNWDTLQIADGGVATLQYIIVRYGGDNGHRRPQMRVNNGGELIMTNSIIEHSNYHNIMSDVGGRIFLEENIIRHTANSRRGLTINLDANTPPPHVVNNDFQNNEDYPMSVFFDSGALTNIRDNTGQNNRADGILIQGTIANGQARWHTNNNFPYILDDDVGFDVNIAADASLTLDPGVIIKFDDATSALFVSGLLQAEGTSTDPIVFTELRDDAFAGDTNNTPDTPGPGNWDFISILDGGAAILNHTLIRYAATLPELSHN